MATLDFCIAGVGPGRGLSAQLQASRRAKSLSASNLAGKTGLFRSTITSLEQGRESVACAEGRELLTAEPQLSAWLARMEARPGMAVTSWDALITKAGMNSKASVVPLAT